MSVDSRWLDVQECTSTSDRKGYTPLSRKTFMKLVPHQVYGTRRAGKWMIDRVSLDDFLNRDRLEIDVAVARIKRRVT